MRTWLLAVALFLCMIVGLETFWRSRGHRPSVVDSEALWSFHRDRVAHAGEDAVVLVGLSRMLLGFDGEAFRQQEPGRELINLAVDGHAPAATLRDLALTEEFGGLVICQISAPGFERAQRDKQQAWVDHYHDRSGWNERADSRMASLVQGNLCVANPQLRFSKVVPQLMRGRGLPVPMYVVTHDDRLKSADYSMMGIGRHRAWRVARRKTGYQDATIPSPSEWAQEAAEFRPWVEAIEARGGVVVFVRFPTSGEHLQLDQQYYPRADYWDRVSELTGATTIHFCDVKGMDGFDCPDTSHLDQKDAPAFTRALLEDLRRRGLLGAGSDLASPR